MEPMIGVNIPGGTNLENLDRVLTRIEAEGWQAAELNLSSCPLILGGQVQPRVAEYVRQVLGRHRLHYTAHTGYGLDLRQQEQAAMHADVMRASLEVCARLGIDRLNFHYEQRAEDPALEAQFMTRMTEACDLGQRLGVAVNIENVEVEHYRWALEAVKLLNHPNCGMTLDLGHLWIAAHYFGFDYLPAVEACAPYVRHLHINDNHGVFEPMRLTNKDLYDTLDKGYRFAFSRGDIHIPPLWGSAPLREAFAILSRAGYGGIWLCEYYSQYFTPFNSDIRQKVLEAVRETAAAR